MLPGMERLLLINLEAAAGGTVLLQTIWATTLDLAGHRLTRTVDGLPALLLRLDELMPAICR
jgi:hypothetical protein